ncbi:hypothetical protein ACP275_05G108200 [Erythranthe tilingii]
MATLFSTLPSSPIQHRKIPCNSCPIKCCHEKANHNSPIIDENGFPEKNLLSNPRGSKPPRPRRIILVRHGQSQGNVDECVYTRVADPKVMLTQQGISEAEECGEEIRRMVEKDGNSDWKVYFYVSPYKRSLETLRNLAKPFERSRIAGVREEPRLREQDFGNFQDQEQMKIQKAARKLYGRFFYRFPNGESAADVYDRITATWRAKPRHEFGDSFTWSHT